MSNLTKHRISVVIPSKNEQNVIRDCIISLLFQTHPIHEIVLVDASDDQTPWIVTDLCRKANISYQVIMDKSLNIGQARRVGVERSSGDLILSCDADTIFPHDWVERAVKWIDKYGAIMVFGRAEPRNSLDPVRDLIYRLMHAAPVAKGYAMLIRKEYADFGPYNIFEDTDLWFRNIPRGLVIYDPTLVVKVRMPTTLERNIEKTINKFISDVANLLPWMRERR